MLDIKTTTRKLAIKITLIVFVFFLASFCLLILLHHYKFLYEEKQNLQETVLFVKHDQKFFDNLLENVCMWKCEKMKLITRDFLVTRWDKIVMKNWIYDMIDIDQFINNELELWKVSHISLWEKKDFYVMKEFYKWYNLYFTRDISFHTDYEHSLIIIFIFLSIFLSGFIYLFSLKLARISLEPLKEYNNSLKLYNHHIAHELKTPLAVLKSELWLLKIWCDKNVLKSCINEVDNMAVLIDSMLFLSENIVLNKIEKINILDIIDDLMGVYNWKDGKILIKKGNIWVDLLVNWDKVFLKTMFKNIFENAIKYSSSKDIYIIFNKNSIEFENTYKWVIKEEEKNTLFNAFYKLNHNVDSYWLGLSIVKKIADLHWFKIELEVKNRKFKIKITFINL